MASVRKIKTKSGVAWQARWRERERSCARNFANKRDAVAYAARMADRRDVGADRLGTGAFLARFMDEIETSGDYSPATVDCYKKMTTLAARVLGTIPLSRLTTAGIDDGYAALMTGAKPLSRWTVRLIHRVLVAALNRAVKRGLIAVNPAINASPPSAKSETHKVRVFAPEEVTALLAAAAGDAAPDTLAIVSLLLATGLRRGELLGLTVGDVDLDAGTLDVRGTVIEVNYRPVARDRGKSAAAQRTLALPPTVVALLRAQRARVQEMMLGTGVRAQVYLFPGPLGAHQCRRLG